jgi:hypothetical protein
LTSSSPASSADAKLYPKKEYRRSTSLLIAGNLIERNLSATFSELHYALINIWESGLVMHDRNLQAFARELIDQAAPLSTQLYHLFPLSMRGRARHLNRQTTLTGEIELYRQEAFWCSKSLPQCEDAEAGIRALFDFFTQAHSLLRAIDRANHVNDPVRSASLELKPNLYLEAMRDQFRPSI